MFGQYGPSETFKNVWALLLTKLLFPGATLAAPFTFVVASVASFMVRVSPVVILVVSTLLVTVPL